jgi:hypothetical protein
MTSAPGNLWADEGFEFNLLVATLPPIEPDGTPALSIVPAIRGPSRPSERSIAGDHETPSLDNSVQQLLLIAL